MSAPHVWTRAPLRFVIASHEGRDGVTLSLRGSWANLPYATDEGAARAAEAHANGRPYKLERERFPALPPYRGASTCKSS